MCHISIKSERNRLGITQKQLAERLGVDQSAVAQWETGRSGPARSKLRDIAEALNCSVAALLDDDEEERW